MNNKKVDFLRQDTKAVKGIAVAMMLFHHLAAFPERLPVGFEGFKNGFLSGLEENYISYIAQHSKLCVAIFFFLGGYGMYRQMSSEKFSLTKSIQSLFVRYWRIFLIFVPIAFIFFRRSEGVTYLSGRYNLTEIKDYVTTIIGNLTMLSNTINMEWWFLKTYVCTLILGTAFCYIMRKKNNFAFELIAAFGIDILFRTLIPSLSYNVTALRNLFGNFFYVSLFSEASTISPFFVGIVLAKYNGIVRLKEIFSRVPFKSLVGLVGALSIIWSRCYIYGEGLDALYAAFFTVFLSLFFDGINPLKIAVAFVGKYSTDMWLIHSFYCYYFLEATKIVYSTQNVWVDFLILFAMTLLSSIIVEYFYKIIGFSISGVRKIKERRYNKENNLDFAFPENHTEETAVTTVEENTVKDNEISFTENL